MKTRRRTRAAAPIAALLSTCALLTGTALRADKPPPPVVVVVFPSTANPSESLETSMIQLKGDLRQNPRIELLQFDPASPSFILAAREAKLDLGKITSEDDRVRLAQSLEAQLSVTIADGQGADSAGSPTVDVVVQAVKSSGPPAAGVSADNDSIFDAGQLIDEQVDVIAAARLAQRQAVEAAAGAAATPVTGAPTQPVEQPSLVVAPPPSSPVAPPPPAVPTPAPESAPVSSTAPAAPVAPVTVPAPPPSAPPANPVNSAPPPSHSSVKIESGPAVEPALPPGPTATTPPSGQTPAAAQPPPEPAASSSDSQAATVKVSPPTAVQTGQAVQNAPTSAPSPPTPANPQPASAASATVPQVVSATVSPSTSNQSGPAVVNTPASVPAAPQDASQPPAPVEVGPQVVSVTVSQPGMTDSGPTVETAPVSSIVPSPAPPASSSAASSPGDVGTAAMSAPSPTQPNAAPLGPASPASALPPTPLDADTQSWMEQGEDALSHADTGRAIESFRRAVDASPRNAAPRIQLAKAYIAAGSDDQALDELRRAVAVDPTSTDLQTYLGDLSKRGDLPGVDTILLQVEANSNPSDPQTLLALGDSYWNTGHLDLAEQTYQEAAQIPDCGPDPFARLARLYAATQRYDDCIAALAHSGDAGYPAALRIIKEQAETLIGDADSAIQDFQAGNQNRSTFYNSLKASDTRISAYASFISKITPPAAYKVSFLHRRLAANLLAQMTPELENYALTANTQYLSQGQDLEHSAESELSEANVADKLQQAVLSGN